MHDDIPDPASLPWHERAELSRQGAKAAARGECPTTNPMQDARNQPQTTGEAEGLWAERNAAWLEGHVNQTAAGIHRPGWSEEERV